jgi:hypothetical protein
MVTGCLNIQAVVPFNVYKWRFIYIWSCYPHMSAVYISNDTRKPSTFVETLLNFSFPLIGWPFKKLVCLRRKGMGYSLNTSANRTKTRGVYGIFILDILTFDSNFNLCYIHQTLAHCSLKYYNNDKNNRPRITYFVLTRFCVFSKKNTYLLEFIIYKSVGILFSLTKFFKYTEATFIKNCWQFHTCSLLWYFFCLFSQNVWVEL